MTNASLIILMKQVSRSHRHVPTSRGRLAKTGRYRPPPQQAVKYIGILSRKDQFFQYKTTEAVMTDNMIEVFD